MARMTSIPSGNPGGHEANGSTGISFGAAASGGSAAARTLPLAHIDDVTSVTIDYDRHTPIDKLLAIAEDLLRQAETYRTFGGRIDMAMMSYIKANILLLDVMKKNKGWVSLQADNKAQRHRYSALVRQAQAAHGVFEEIKSEIKSDNARSGIQPKVHRPLSAGVSSASIERPGLGVPKEERTSLEHGGDSGAILTPTFSPTSAKARPSVRPKPEALHGHAFQPSGVAAKRAAEELTSRFAKLRSPTSAPQQPGVQDPRIRTQPIVLPPQAERRDAVVPPGRPSLSVDSNLFELPKLPGAIYKPARGTVSTEAAELPSSSSRRFSLARSLTSGSLTSATAKPPLPGPGPGEESNDWAKRPKISIPEGETLSVTELLRLMKEGSKSVSILLIDIRSREAFDEGHIMSQATICIEPEVLMRKNISASEIAESMVLAPSAEQINFERRHGFDLVIFYDQDSTRIGTKKDNPDEMAVRGLYNALTYFDYVGETNPKPPKLLEGGLDAWTSVMGSNSLATTESSVGRPLESRAKAKPSMHTPARRQSYVPKPIQDPDEARRWEESTNDPRSFKPAMTVDDFMRRYPQVSDVKESMISTSSVARTGDGACSVSPPSSVLPAPPTRPAPTVTRPSYAGLKERDETEPTKRPGRIRSEGDKKYKELVGLRNPRNWCYANSSLQALFGTSGFADDLFKGNWERDYRVPRKSDEKIPNPQLLAKMLSQLFAWMEKAMIHPMEARTLMQYLKHVHSKDHQGRKRPEYLTFGGEYQQDAQEFFNFITQHLHDETNIHRDQGEGMESIPDDDDNSVLHNAIRYWRMHTAKHESIVTKYWRGLEANLSICPRCKHRSTTIQVFDQLTCSLQPSLTLQESLKYNARVEHMEGFVCPKCKKEGRGEISRERKTILCRLPDRLTFHVMRFHHEEGENPKKDNSRFKFPIRDLDMEPYWVPSEERGIPESDKDDFGAAKTDRHFCPPFKYDCYAVICHIGKTLRNGHYIAYVRDQTSKDPTDWIKFDDTNVTRVKVGSGGDDETENLYGKGHQQAYLVFYQRNS